METNTRYTTDVHATHASTTAAGTGTSVDLLFGEAICISASPVFYQVEAEHDLTSGRLVVTNFRVLFLPNEVLPVHTHSGCDVPVRVE